jgi:serine-type D-Ala-D-Ala carboxypeptidase/endopeptidase
LPDLQKTTLKEIKRRPTVLTRSLDKIGGKIAVNQFRSRIVLSIASAFAASLIASCGVAHAEDKLLTEAVNFTGTIAFLTTKVPGFILVAVRNGDTAFAGFGKVTDKNDNAPNANTMFRIGSISKVFCGEVLASMVLDGKVRFTDPLQDRLGYDVKLPERAGHPIRLIDLVTQSSGLPREVPRPDGPADDPFVTNTREAQIADLKTDPLLFPAGSAALYSNYGFDLLGAALANAAGKPYADLLKERVLDPLGMKDTVFNPRPGDAWRMMQGHSFDGSPMPAARTPTSIECAGGLHTTANDMARWMKWHLDRFATADRELRMLDHAAYLYRDGLTAISGLDDAGPMDAMGLGWVINMPTNTKPIVLQKTGGLQGSFAYLAIAPTRGVAAFFVMNEFSTNGFSAAVAATNGLIAQLAPR